MKRLFASCFAAGVCLAAGVVQATDYMWAGGERGKSGNWSDPAMWTGGDGTSYPKTLEDTASFPTWSDHTVTFTEDIEIGTLGKSNGFNYTGVIFDLGGHTLTVHQASEVLFTYEVPTEKNMTPFKQPTFKNGELVFASDSKGVQMGGNGQPNCGGFTLDGATSNLKFNKPYTYNTSKIVIKNGGVWNCPLSQCYQYNQKVANEKGGFVQVTGVDSQLNMTNCSTDLTTVFNGNEGGLYVQDGAEANFNANVEIGGSYLTGVNQKFSTNSFIVVEDATVNIGKRLLFGGWWQWGYKEQKEQYGPTLSVKGKASVTVGDEIHVWDGVAAKFEYHPTSAGWKTAPVRAKSLSVAPRGEGMPYSGTTTNLIHAADWAALSGTAIPLLELTTANAEALAGFAAHSVVVDYDETLFPAPPTVGVSDDGKKLLLTAPAGVREDLLLPELTASCDMVGLGVERVSLAFATFGRNCTELDEAAVVVYDNADCEGAPVAVKELDVAQMTDPAGTYEVVFDGLDLGKTYWAKACAKNACGCEATAVVKIDEDLMAPPRYTVTRDAVELDSERVTLTFSTFGCVFSEISEAKVFLYGNPACTGEPLTVNVLDVAAMTDPKGAYSTLFEKLDFRTVYGVKVVVKNTAGAEKEETADFSTPGAAGATFTWNTDAGDFESAASWKLGTEAASSYPTTNDTIDIAKSGAVVTLRSDETVAGIASIGQTSNPVLDLNGHALRTTSSKETMLLNYNYATEENLETFLPTLTVKNGELGKNVNFQVYNGSRPGTGCVIFDNARYVDGKLIYRIGNGFRIFVQNGSYMKLGNGVNDFAWENNAAFSGYGFFCVRGKGSYFTTTYDNGGSSKFTLNGNHNGFYVLDGAAATMTMSLCIGGGSPATNNFAEVDNATLTNKHNLAFGWANSWKTWNEVGTVSNPQLRIKGENARVLVGKDIRILDGIGAEIRYTVPTNGFAATPLTAATLSVHDRSTSYVPTAPARFYVDAKDWKRAHPEESQTLLTLTTANKEGLERLVSKSKVRGAHCTLSVTDDGKSVVVTAPPLSGLTLIVR